MGWEDSEECELESETELTRQKFARAHLIWFTGALLLSNSITLLLSCSLLHRNWRPVDGSCSRESNAGSENHMLSIDTTLRETSFTALKFVPNNFSAPAGGDIDVDAAWASIGTDYDRFLITQEEASSLPYLTEDHVFVTPSSILSGPSMSRSGYPVFMESFHQLHCLNLMRQALYFNVDFYRSRAQGPWKMESYWIQNHIQHCLDYLRQIVMCNADTGLIPFRWHDREGNISLDYVQHRQCRDFRAVLEWAEEHVVDLNGGDVQLRPPVDAVFWEPSQQG